MRFLPAIFIALLLGSCGIDSVYEANKDMSKRVWMIDSIVSFPIHIKDASTPYQLNLSVRNTAEYPFYNLYVVYYLRDSTGQVISTDLKNLHLFDAKTGKPLASGLAGIYSHKFSLVDRIDFDSGSYSLEIEQNMRLDTLPGIVSVGLEVMQTQ